MARVSVKLFCGLEDIMPDFSRRQHYCDAEAKFFAHRVYSWRGMYTSVYLCGRHAVMVKKLFGRKIHRIK